MLLLGFIQMDFNKRMETKVILFAVICILSVVIPTEGTICKHAETCAQCFTLHKDCTWCADEVFQSGRTKYTRCDIEDNLIKKKCNSIINPDNDLQFIKNENLRDEIGNKTGIHIQPQVINLKLRPRKPHRIELAYREAKDSAVDLYVLMDLSASMKRSKETLSKLGQTLAKEMKKITKKFLLGFGSYVEKEIPPFVFTDSNITMCSDCAMTYDYRHVMKLSPNGTKFSQMVAAAEISGSNDIPEAGFDALMQTLVCEQIGWRSKSRKLVLFIAGSSFHTAGSGKLLGVVKPNDERCHLTAAGEYSESKVQDYPSVSQIRSQVNSKKVNVIFAVPKDQLMTYKHLSNFLLGSTVTTLQKDSANILDVIKSNYRAIVRRVQLRAENNENITVKFFSKCNSDELKETDVCENLDADSKVSFAVEIEVDKCPEKEADRKRTFTIHPIGLANTLTIHLELLCECNCTEATKVPDECSGKGVKKCGACICKENYVGRNCECDRENVTNQALDELCKNPDTGLICSDRGQCVCGVCMCDNIKSSKDRFFSEQYCQCDDYSCDIIDGKLCGGSKQGVCNCGVCKCKDGFEGPNCLCSTNNSTCIAENGFICNGKGICECGKCICDKESLHRGPLCEDCPTCSGMCSETKHCVQCKIFQSGNYTSEVCDKLCNDYEITAVEELSEDSTRKKCQFVDDDHCTFLYKYWYEGTKVSIEAKKGKSCPIPDYVVPLAVVIGIILLGIIALLIFKCVTTIYDRREYAQFLLSKEDARWSPRENPIYKVPKSTYMNPLYGGKKSYPE
ncbi:integrin beta pat-3 isoform X3 [Octopus sinensis]|uniref:Integrin beta n=1 Tax=Octopus sinensis TaxID=2607531 RepID=A0A7E6FDA7_9MOLL|nr:integrin beta pat-3 isoform X3 [Octopus sinensis]